MPKTSSTLALDTPLPAFALPDVASGRMVSSDALVESTALLIMFVCNHCPYVKHVERELGRLARDYATEPVAIVAICANDSEAYPDDAPAGLAEQAVRAGWSFPYLVDDSQATARAFAAVCTPEFYLFGPTRTLRYRGRLDASRPGSAIPVTGADLRAALDAVLAGRAVAAEQHASVGCGIKWKVPA